MTDAIIFLTVIVLLLFLIRRSMVLSRRKGGSFPFVSADIQKMFTDRVLGRVHVLHVGFE
jgi:hypothetical protein